MLHVLLLILKIIGITLLVILGLVLLIVLLLLFVPVRYSGDGRFKRLDEDVTDVSTETGAGAPDGDDPGDVILKAESTANFDLYVLAKITWLLHFISFSFNFDGDMGYRLKILGISVIREGNQKKQEAKPEDNKTEENKTEEEKPEANPEEGKTEGKEKPEVKPEEGKPEEKEKLEAKQEEGKTEEKEKPEIKPEESKTEGEEKHELKPEESKTEENKPGDDKTPQDNPQGSKEENQKENKEENKEEKDGKDGKAGNKKDKNKKPGNKKGKKDKKKDKEGNNKDDNTAEAENKGEKQSVVEKIKNIYNKFTQLRDDKKVQRAYEIVKVRLVKLLKAICPRKLGGYAKYGFEDPAVTGYITAFLAAEYGRVRDLDIEPHFEDEILEGELKFKGRIFLITIVCIALKFLLNKDIKYTTKKLKEFKEEITDGGNNG